MVDNRWRLIVGVWLMVDGGMWIVNTVGDDGGFWMLGGGG